MKVVHGVTYFVEGLVLWNNKLSIGILCILFKERFHLPSTIQEIVSSVIFLGLKLINFFSIDVKIINYLCHFILEHLNGMFIVNIVENCISVHPKLLYCLRC